MQFYRWIGEDLIILFCRVQDALVVKLGFRVAQEYVYSSSIVLRKSM
jgi:hypothetical protein